MEPNPGYVEIEREDNSDTERIAREAGDEIVQTGSINGPKFQAAADHVAAVINGNASDNGRHIVRLEDIAAADDIRIEWVPVPEWAPANASQSVKDTYGMYVRSMNGRERARWHTDVSIQKGKETQVNFLALHVSIITIAACDKFGNAIYTDADRKILLKKNSAVLARIAARAGDLSEIGEEEIETISGNSTANLADE